MKKKLLILGATGMVGSALVRQAEKMGYTNILKPRSTELNLCDQFATHDYLNSNATNARIMSFE